MLTCRDLSHQADAFLDGELGLWQRLRIRQHLSMCNGCAQFMGQMRTTRSLILAEANAADVGERRPDRQHSCGASHEITVRRPNKPRAPSEGPRK